MKTLFLQSMALFLLLPILSAHADDLKQCSTEKVNHGDCTVVIDRRYPVMLPTIQMSPDTKVFVVIQEPLAFETLSLDETSASALPGTDQGAALLTAAIPDLKGLTWSNVTVPSVSTMQPQAAGVDPCQPAAYDAAACQAKQEEEARVDALNNTFKVLNAMLDKAQSLLPMNKSDLLAHIEVVYAQLNQILAPIPETRFGRTRNS